jgi:hypothetical protein
MVDCHGSYRLRQRTEILQTCSSPPTHSACEPLPTTIDDCPPTAQQRRLDRVSVVLRVASDRPQSHRRNSEIARQRRIVSELFRGRTVVVPESFGIVSAHTADTHGAFRMVSRLVGRAFHTVSSGTVPADRADFRNDLQRFGTRASTHGTSDPVYVGLSPPMECHVRNVEASADGAKSHVTGV